MPLICSAPQRQYCLTLASTAYRQYWLVPMLAKPALAACQCRRLPTPTGGQTDLALDKWNHPSSISTSISSMLLAKLSPVL